MFPRIRTVVLVGFILAYAMIVGCAPKSYPVATPMPSEEAYEKVQKSKLSAQLVDERREADKTFHFGILSATLENDGNPIDPVEFLLRNVEKELDARGVDFSFSNQETDKENITVVLREFQIRNHRASGFSPYYTFTTFSADAVVDGKTSRITAYFKNGKVPVWSFEEVIEPCYNIPVDVAVKEIASKINRFTANYHISDADVDAIIKDLKNNFTELSFIDVYDLGFGNNKRAIPYLLELTKHSEAQMRIAALSSLGTIGAVDQMEFLEEVFKTAPWEERNAALKSIGDFGTPEALEFVKNAMRKYQSESNDPNGKYTVEVASLYL